MPTLFSRLRFCSLLLALCPLSVFGLDVLFVGNSFTYGFNNYNRLAVADLNGTNYGGVPALFKKFADEGHHPDVNVSIEAIAGYYLNWHYSNKRALFNRSWDVVVLQDHSTGPLYTHSAGDVTGFRSAVKNLATFLRARNPNVRIYLYETWARPDQVINGTYTSLEAMQFELRTAYSGATREYGLTGWTPVGEAFMKAVADGISYNPATGAVPGVISLWDTDNYHASRYGAFLSALVFYRTILGGDPRTLPTGAGSAVAGHLLNDAARAVLLQQLAWDVTSPIIRSQPRTQAALLGAPAQLSVEVATAGCTYQWRRNGVPIPGATGATLTVPVFTTGDIGRYDVLVAFPIGETALSSPVALAVADHATSRTFLVDLGSVNTGYPTPSPDGESRSWNQLTATHGGFQIPALTDTAGDSSGAPGLFITSSFSGINTAGVETTGAYPATAQRDSFFVTGSGSVGNQSNGVLSFANLSPSANYTFRLFGSRNATGQRVTRFTIPGLAPVHLDTVNNTGATVTLGPVTADSSGSVTLSVQPLDASGTLQEYGYVGVLELTEQTTVASGFATWCAMSGLPFAASAPTDDPDADGLPNLLEYALGMDPLNAGPVDGTSPDAAAVIDVGGLHYLSVQLPKNAEAPDAALVVEVSADLAMWQSGPAHTTVVTDTAETLRVRDNTPINQTSRRFIRVRATLAE